MKPGDVVLIEAFDEVPEHWFLVEEVLDDCVTGRAVTGPLAGECGEPELTMIVRVVTPDEVALGSLLSQ